MARRIRLLWNCFLIVVSLELMTEHLFFSELESVCGVACELFSETEGKGLSCSQLLQIEENFKLCWFGH